MVCPFINECERETTEFFYMTVCRSPTAYVSCSYYKKKLKKKPKEWRANSVKYFRW